MKSLFWIVPCCLLGAGWTLAQPPVGNAPVPPTLQLVRETKPAEGKIVLRMSVPVSVAQESTNKVILNGKVIEVKQIFFRTVFVERDVLCETKTSRFLTAKGKKLAVEEVWKRLKPNVVVAVSPNGAAPAAEYLRALSADTVVIIPPMEAQGPGPLFDPRTQPKLVPQPEKLSPRKDDK